MNGSRAVKFCAVGDVTAFHKEPESGYELVHPALSEMDVVVAQNERHYTNRDDIFPVGGFTERTVPEHAAALKLGNYDVLTFASNHLLDLGPYVLLETIGVLRDLGFAVVGAGENIDEARKPAFIRKDDLTFGFLAYCSVLRPNYQAGPTSPGAAPMRAHTHYHKKDHKPGTKPEIHTFPYPEDLAALVDDVERARRQCDFLCVSMHWGLNGIKGVIPDYEIEVAHAAVDAGADLVHGSGPHRLKGFEIYKDKPVFYSLGNFCFDQPRWVLDEGRRQSPEHAAHMDAQDWTYDPEYEEWYAIPAENRKSVMTRIDVTDTGIERVSFRPVMINKRAQPELLKSSDPRFDDVLTYVREVTEGQGFDTKFVVENDEVVISR